MAVFNLYTPLLVAVEGGYQALPNDKGNYNSRGELVGTNHGISAKVYEAWIGRVPNVSDMKTITQSIAFEIYKAWYWNKIGASSIKNQSIAELIMDHAVNAGTGAAGKLVQKVLNNQFEYQLAIDGAIGNKTIAAINHVNSKKLYQDLKTARHNFYVNIGGPFLNVWLNRLGNFVFTEKKKPSQDLV